MGVEELWLTYSESKSKKIRDELILHYMILVEKTARRIHSRLPSQVEVEDLASYGIFGLIDAIDKFEPERGLKFETYAPQRISGAIYDGMRKMDWVPRTERSTAKSLDETIASLSISLQRAPSDEEIAEHIGWDIEKLRQAQSEQHRHHMTALHAPVTSDEGEAMMLVDVISDGHDQVAAAADLSAMKDRLAGTIEQLDNREQTVLVLYYFERLKFSEIGKLMDVSESRVCQIHNQSIDKIRESLLVGN